MFFVVEIQVPVPEHALCEDPEAVTSVLVTLNVGTSLRSALAQYDAVCAGILENYNYVRLVLVDGSGNRAVKHVLSRHTPSGVGDW